MDPLVKAALDRVNSEVTGLAAYGGAGKALKDAKIAKVINVIDALRSAVKAF
jgi:hypothetical protein